jgi:uncharacterized membrane protein
MNRRPMILVSAAVIGVMLVASVWAYASLPADAQVPIHWGPDGQPDGYAGKAIGLFLLPAIAAAVAAVFWVLPRIEPRRANLERSGKAYAATWIGVMLLLGGLHLLAISVAMGADLDLTRIVLMGTGALFIVIGNYLPKVRSNFLMGIRTPWTLTSDRSWARTHRLGGRLFVLEGLILVVAGLLGIGGPVQVGLIIAGVAIIVGVAFVYSYIVWRDDPERRTT